MYTTLPLAPIDTLNYHGGFHTVVYAAIAAVIICQLLPSMFGRLGGQVFVIVAFICPTIVGIAACVSYKTGYIKTFENQQVTEDLVGVIGGTRHNLFVEYSVDGKLVSFPAATGLAYPKRAILYKN